MENFQAELVGVPKKNGRVQLCSDYKVMLNQVLNVEQYPLPKPDDLFATLAGGDKFTVLDLMQAYLQFLLNDDSRQNVTISTHRGLYRFTLLPYKVAIECTCYVPENHQHNLSRLIYGVICYINDILITGSNNKEHLQNLKAVFQRLQSHGLHLKSLSVHFNNQV